MCSLVPLERVNPRSFTSCSTMRWDKTNEALHWWKKQKWQLWWRQLKHLLHIASSLFPSEEVCFTSLSILFRRDISTPRWWPKSVQLGDTWLQTSSSSKSGIGVDVIPKCIIEELYMMVVYTIQLTKILKEVANITCMHMYFSTERLLHCNRVSNETQCIHTFRRMFSDWCLIHLLQNRYTILW